jgi:predicted NBD/HSP70 family sugar kinase
MTYILFDIGGTKTRVAASEDLKTFSKHTSFKTPKKFEEGIEAIVKAAQECAQGPIRAIGGGVRGILNDEKTTIVYDSVLKGWIDKPLTETLKKKCNAEVYLENDAALAGLGEVYFGAGQGIDIVAYHTVSTGVGGAKIEYGKTILGEDIEPTLENLVSGSALEARMGVKPYEIDQSDAIWDQLALFLAHGLRNTILYWSPDAVILGGSMILGDPRILLDAIITHTNEVLGETMDCPLIVDAKLKDESGLYGAMAKLSQLI